MRADKSDSLSALVVVPTAAGFLGMFDGTKQWPCVHNKTHTSTVDAGIEGGCCNHDTLRQVGSRAPCIDGAATLCIGECVVVDGCAQLRAKHLAVVDAAAEDNAAPM